MTNEFISDIMELIRCALTAAPVSLPEHFDWNAAYTLASEHQIAALLYCGIQISKCKVPEKLFRLFRQSMIQSAVLDEIQTREMNRIRQSFQDQKIDFMTLKGIDIKPLYPDRATRVMSDIDLLIRTEQYDRIKPIMRSCGFIKIGESEHEMVWRKYDMLTVELHTQLNPSYDKSFKTYYGDGWKLAHLCDTNSHRYHLHTEDQFIYLFTHFSKHYKNGGVGLRQFIDLWIYHKANLEMDSGYIRSELTKLHLFTFYTNIIRTLSVWFDDFTPDDMTIFITKRIFESGSYGTAEAKMIASVIKCGNSSDSSKRKKRKSFFHVMFLPYCEMKSRYPVLVKIPFLLPLFWLIRILDTLLFHKDKIKKQKTRYKSITPSSIDQYQQELNYVGLGINFKE